MSRPERPTGIAILVLANLVLAAVSLCWNLLLLWLGFEFNASLYGLALMLRALLAGMLVVGAGLLWSGRPNARLFAQFFYVAGLILDFKMLLADTRIAWQLGEDTLGLLLTLRYGLEMGIFGACLVYLSTDNARSFFRRVAPRLMGAGGPGGTGGSGGASELDELTS